MLSVVGLIIHEIQCLGKRIIILNLERQILKNTPKLVYLNRFGDHKVNSRVLGFFEVSLLTVASDSNYSGLFYFVYLHELSYSNGGLITVHVRHV